MLIEKDSHEFAKVLEQSRKRGEVTEFSKGIERRKFPRLQVSSHDIWVDSMMQFVVADMSPSGVALTCNHPVRLGEVLRFALGPLQGADAKVVACELEESPTEYLDAQYRVHCKFLNIKQGMRLVVKAKQLDQRIPKQPKPPVQPDNEKDR